MFLFGVGEGALVALEGHLSLTIEMQFPVGNSCKWVAPFFVEHGTKTCTGIRLIYLPHNIECPISFASRFIRYAILETWVLQTHKNDSSISLNIATTQVLWWVHATSGAMLSIWCQYMSISSMDIDYTNEAGQWCHKCWVKDCRYITADHHSW